MKLRKPCDCFVNVGRSTFTLKEALNPFQSTVVFQYRSKEREQWHEMVSSNTGAKKENSGMTWVKGVQGRGLFKENVHKKVVVRFAFHFF